MKDVRVGYVYRDSSEETFQEIIKQNLYSLTILSQKYYIVFQWIFKLPILLVDNKIYLKAINMLFNYY